MLDLPDKTIWIGCPWFSSTGQTKGAEPKIAKPALYSTPDLQFAKALKQQRILFKCIHNRIEKVHVQRSNQVGPTHSVHGSFSHHISGQAKFLEQHKKNTL